MLMPTIKRTDPEKVYGVFRNVDSVSLVHGDVVKHQNFTADATASMGVDVLKGTDADEPEVAGVVHGKDITIQEYGMIQVFGYHGSVKAQASATVLTEVSTDATDGTAKGTASSGTTPMPKFGTVLKAVSGGRAGVFIRAM